MRRPFPFKVASLDLLVSDESADAVSRLVAVRSIARMGGPEAIIALQNASCLKHRRVRHASLLAWGPIGNAGTLVWLDRIAELADPTDHDTIAISRLLIAYRLGHGGDLPQPRGERKPENACTVSALASRLASHREIERGVWAPGNEAYGVDPGPGNAFSFFLHDEHWLIALDRRALELLVKSPSGGSCVLGIISEQDGGNPDDYFVSSILLAKMTRGRGRLLAVNPAGRFLMDGEIDSAATGLRLHLRGLSCAEAPPIEIKIGIESDGTAVINHIYLTTNTTRKLRLSVR